MITYVVLQVPILIFGFLISFLPTITELPFGIDSYLSDGIGYLNYLELIFPPIASFMAAFLWVVSFKLGLKVFAMIPIVNKFLHK